MTRPISRMHTTSSRCRPRRNGLIATAAVGLMLAVAGCGGAGGGDGTGPMTFAVPDQSMSAATASYATVPETAGYFEAGGLEVTMQPVESALAAIQSVASGQATCTYASTANAMTLAATDPGTVILGTTNGNIFRTVAPAASGFDSIDDLVGRTIGVSVLGSVSVDLAQGGMRAAGVEATDEQFLAVGYGTQAAQAFRAGDIQAYSGYDGPNLVIEGLLDEPLVELESPANELTGTSSMVCAREAVDTAPDRIAALWRAFFQGMVFAQENPEAAVRMHWENFPASKPGGADEAVLLRTATEQLAKRLETTGGPGSAGQYGRQNDEDLEATRTFYAENGIVTPEARDTPLTRIVDYSLVERYNDFDEAAVRQQAAAWTGQDGG
ncbi:ABC transporter substrate-binding protein [Pseudonocardia sichuanensis]